MKTVNKIFTDYEYGIRLPDSSKLANNWKKHYDVEIWRNDVIVSFLTLLCFLCQVQLLDQVSCQYIIGSEVMTIFSYKGLTRNPEIRNTSRLSFAQYLEGHQIGMNVSNKILLNASKCHGYRFYPLWVVKRKPTVGGKN